MTRRALRIAVAGGIPPSIGGGGLEIQRAATADGLRRLGCEIVEVERAPADASWDLLHVFGSEPDTFHLLRHWVRHPSPLVLSPVIVADLRASRIMGLAARTPRPLTSARMRHQILSRADLIVTNTHHERRVVRAINPNAAEPVVVPNGAFHHVPATEPLGPARAVLLLGTISRRKRQLETVRHLAGGRDVVAVGELADVPAAEWTHEVSARGITWIREPLDGPSYARLQRDALALVHLSAAEVQSLAVIETISQGTPVILSDIPGHRELRERYPALVFIARSPADVESALVEIEYRGRGRPATTGVPSWHDVAEQLLEHYEALLLHSAAR